MSRLLGFGSTRAVSQRDTKYVRRPIATDAYSVRRPRTGSNVSVMQCTSSATLIAVPSMLPPSTYLHFYFDNVDGHGPIGIRTVVNAFDNLFIDLDELFCRVFRSDVRGRRAHRDR